MNKPPDPKMPKPRKTQARPATRVAFTDGDASAPATMAVDAAPKAGDTPLAYSVDGVGTFVMTPYGWVPR